MNFKLYLFFAFTIFIRTIFAQAPEKINYQAVARDVSGNPLINTTVNVQFDIRQSSSTGTIVYSETHGLNTNQFGLFTAQIGGGNPISGTFSGINWSTGIYYLQVIINGDVMPATQLLSVPYALHANTATSGTPGANGHANLADSVAEPAGSNCANGGYLIYMGADDNDDGFLQPLERDISYYICNGLDGSANNNDTSATNELQTLSINGDTLFISDGNYVLLPSSGSGVWNTNVNGIDYTAGNVGIGVNSPNHKLTVLSPDTVIANFVSSNPNGSLINVASTNSNVPTGVSFISGLDSGFVAIEPSQNSMYVSNTTFNGHLGLVADSSVGSFAKFIAHSGEKMLNEFDTIFNISNNPNGVWHLNSGSFITDSLYVIGANATQTNWILANSGGGQAVWTDPNSLGLGGSLWTQGTGDVYNSTDSIGIGVANPIALLHVSGGGIGEPIALFEKGGFLNATIDINNTSSNGSGINFMNGGTLTSTINSSTANVLTLTSSVVEVGNSPKTGIFNVSGGSTIANPTILVHESTTGFSRIKHTNAVANKYWIVEAGLNTNNANSGYSISYNDGVNSSIPFIVYGDEKVGINNLAAPLASLHVMDINTSGNGIVSEGFNQPGLLAVGRNNFASPNRGAVNLGDQIGKIVFPGYAVSSFVDGPQIIANATENFTSTANGSELVFRTIQNGTISAQDALVLLNDGRVEIPINLLIPTNAGVNKVLTSDAFGNASWQTLASTGGNDTSLIDADGDTHIQVEAAPDQDVIHFNLGNSTGYTAAEYFTMIGPRLEVINSGNSIFIGEGAGASDNLSFNNNVFIGLQAGNNTVNGDNNVGVGYQSLQSNNSGAQNTALGGQALNSNVSGSHNTGVGFNVLRDNTGDNNVAIGREAGLLNVSGSNNIFIGHQAGRNELGSNYLYIDNNNTSSPLIWGDFANDTLKVNGNFNVNSAYTFPTTDGSNNQVLTTDGFGNVTWQSQSSSSFWTSTNTGSIHPTTLSDKVGIGTNNPGSTFDVRYTGSDSEASLLNYTQTSATANGTGFYSTVNTNGTGEIAAGEFLVSASGNSTKSVAVFASNIATSILNIGINTRVSGTNVSATNIGGVFNVSGGASHHALQLIDGSEGDGKILTSDATGKTIWKENKIAFEAFMPNTITLNTPSTFLGATPVIFSNEVFDDGGVYNPTTAQFTAKVDGVYMLEVSVTFVHQGGGEIVSSIGFIKNGNLATPIKVSSTTLSSIGQERTVTITSTVKLGAGHTINVASIINNTGVINIRPAETNWFSGHLVYEN